MEKENPVEVQKNFAQEHRQSKPFWIKSLSCLEFQSWKERKIQRIRNFNTVLQWSEVKQLSALIL